MKKKVGFFGGSFDPIHFGHLNLALELKERSGLDELLVCPTPLSPLKITTPPLASIEHRYQMALLAVEEIEGFSLLDLEAQGPSPAYTIDTIRKLVAEAKGEKEFFLLLAEDALSHFDRWKEVEQLVDLATPIVGTRHGFDIQKFVEFPPKVASKLKEGLCIIPAMDISSTRIRQRLKKKLYCGHLLPRKILDYIYQNRLYL